MPSLQIAKMFRISIDKAENFEYEFPVIKSSKTEYKEGNWYEGEVTPS